MSGFDQLFEGGAIWLLQHSEHELCFGLTRWALPCWTLLLVSMQGAPDTVNRDIAVFKAGERTNAGQLVPDLDQAPQGPAGDELRKLIDTGESSLGTFRSSPDQPHGVLNVYGIESARD